jgi:hypothetical protein
MRFVDHSPKSARRPEMMIQTFYPSAIDPAAASVVDVSGGARVTGTDIVLARSRLFHVKGHLDAPPGMTGSVRLTYGIPGFDDIGQAVEAQEGFDISGVPSGSWMLTASAGDTRKSDPGVMVFDMGHRTYETRVPVQVGAEDIENLRVVLSQGAEIAAHITVKGDPAANVNGWISFRGESRDPNTSVIDRDNSFRNRLSLGHYVLDLSNVLEGKELFVESMRTDGRDILSDGLTVAGPGNVSIEIELSPEAGHLEGMVLDKDDKPVGGATVVLAPGTGLPRRYDLFKDATTDQHGQFRLKGIAPGEYSIYAWEDVESGAWLDPAFLRNLEGKSETVKVEPKGQQKIKLKVIAAER